MSCNFTRHLVSLGFLLQTACYKRERREKGREGEGRGEGGILYIHTYVTELLVMTKEFTSPVEVHTAFTICRKAIEVKEGRKRGGRRRRGRRRRRGERREGGEGRGGEGEGGGEGRRRRGERVGREGGGAEEGGGWKEGGGGKECEGQW